MVSRCRTDVDILPRLLLEEPVISFDLFRDKTYELAYRVKCVILNCFCNGRLIVYVNGDLMPSGAGLLPRFRSQTS